MTKDQVDSFNVEIESLLAAYDRRKWEWYRHFVALSISAAFLGIAWGAQSSGDMIGSSSLFAAAIVILHFEAWAYIPFNEERRVLHQRHLALKERIYNA